MSAGDMDNQTLLLPHQLDLIDQVLGDKGRGRTYLEAPPGMGKSTTLRALAAEAVRRNPRARVLFVGPLAALVEQFEMCLSRTVKIMRVDRFAFREMIDRRGSDAVWNEPGVYALTMQFARAPDVRSSLLSANWDLLICDALWELSDGSVSAHFIDELAAVSARTVLAGRLGSMSGGQATATVIRWDKAAAIDADGNSVSPPDPTKIALSYPIATEIHRLHKLAIADRSKLENAEGTLAEALESSPAAAEMLALELEARSAGEGSSHSDQTANMVLRAIDSLYADEKIGALVAFVSNLDPQNSGVRVCVATRFVQTAYYLASALNEIAPVELSIASHDHLRDLGAGPTKILVGGFKSLQLKADLTSIDYLIFYDSGSSTIALELIEAANSLGRVSPLTVASIEPVLRALPTDMILQPGGGRLDGANRS